MNLAGQPRAFFEPEKPDSPPGAVQPSFRVASVDVGGGTTDLMITTYYVEDSFALVPCQNFREAFRIAGEDVVREVIERALVPAIMQGLTAAGASGAPEFLSDRFGGDRAGMPEPDKHLRRQYVLRVLKPAALSLLALYEIAEKGDAAVPPAIKMGTLVAANGEFKAENGAFVPKNAANAMPSGRIADYFDKAAAVCDASPFKMEDVEIPINFETLRGCAERTLGAVFDNISAAIHHFDCDVVLLSGLADPFARNVGDVRQQACRVAGQGCSDVPLSAGHLVSIRRKRPVPHRRSQNGNGRRLRALRAFRASDSQFHHVHAAPRDALDGELHRGVGPGWQAARG